MDNQPIPRPPYRSLRLHSIAKWLLVTSLASFVAPLGCAFMLMVFFFGAGRGAPELKLIDYAFEVVRMGAFVAPAGVLASAALFFAARRRNMR